MNSQATFSIGNRILGENYPAFIVAEVSANHRQDLNLALEMIRSAKACGADAVKFQTYTPDTMTLDLRTEHFMIEHPKWGGQTLHSLYESAYTPWEWFPELQKTARECDIIFFSTAFDPTSIDFLEELEVPVHKIASFELTDIPLISYAAGTGKPLIMSTGMASEEEIEDAVKAALDGGAPEILLLKCVSSYPAELSDMNLRAITRMRDKYGCCIGFSDHSRGNTASVAAVSLGAVFIEKHFILDKSVETPDSFFSIDPDELKDLVETVRDLKQGLGNDDSSRLEQERDSNIFRRSLFVVEDVKAGEIFTKHNIRSIRPGSGLKPKYLPEIIGQKATCDIAKGTPLAWNLVRKLPDGVHAGESS